MAIPVILKGDTSSSITLNIASGWDYTNCVLCVVFNGVAREFDQLVPGGTKQLQYTADDTAGMQLGTGLVKMTLTNAAGVVRSMPWSKIKVTDAPGEVYDGGIIIDPTQLDVSDATAADSLGAVKAKLNAVLAFLRGGAACLLACVGLSAFGDLCPTNTLNDVAGDTTISNLVAASGVSMSGGGSMTTNAVKGIIEAEVGPTNTIVHTPALAYYLTTNAASATYQPKGSYITTESDPTAMEKAQAAIVAAGCVTTNVGATFSCKFADISATGFKLYASDTFYGSYQGDCFMSSEVGTSYFLPWSQFYNSADKNKAIALRSQIPQTAADIGAVGVQELTNTALRVASRTWDTGYNILWEKTAHNGGFYEVCVTNVNLTAGGVQ